MTDMTIKPQEYSGSDCNVYSTVRASAPNSVQMDRLSSRMSPETTTLPITLMHRPMRK